MKVLIGLECFLICTLCWNSPPLMHCFLFIPRNNALQVGWPFLTMNGRSMPRPTLQNRRKVINDSNQENRVSARQQTHKDPISKATAPTCKWSTAIIVPWLSHPCHILHSSSRNQQGPKFSDCILEIWGWQLIETLPSRTTMPDIIKTKHRGLVV